MSLLTDHGLVLRRNRSLEDDVRLSLFLRSTGKITVVVRGGRKNQSKLKSLVEPFTEADLQIFLPPHGVHGRLIGGVLLDSHVGLRGRVETFAYASKCAEVVDVLVPHRMPSSDLYDILRWSFHSLKSSAVPELIWMVFVVKLLKSLGYGDISNEILDVNHESDHATLVRYLQDELSILESCVPISEKGRGRCIAVANSYLERLLPYPLKSEVLV